MGCTDRTRQGRDPLLVCIFGAPGPKPKTTTTTTPSPNSASPALTANAVFCVGMEREKPINPSDKSRHSVGIMLCMRLRDSSLM